MKFYRLTSNVIHWAQQKGLIKPDNAHKQALKMVTEVGELCEELLKDDLESFKNELGDVQVTLIILAEQKGVNLTECLELAYDKISKRKGKTIDGIFIKD